MEANINPVTGIRYGYISARNIHPDVLDTLMYAVGRNITVLEADKEATKLAEREADSIEEEVRIAIAEAGGFTDRKYEDVLEEWIEKAYEKLGYYSRETYIELRVQDELDDFFPDEPIIEFDYEGVKGSTSWLGGSLHLWVFESPRFDYFQECSPCVPNAGNLNCPDPDGVQAYDVPEDWRNDEGM